MEMMNSKQQTLRMLASHKNEQWDNLEKLLITIVASGFLGASVALISGSKQGTFGHVKILVSSWIAFAGCLVFLILSYVATDIADVNFIRKAKRKADTEMIDWEKEINKDHSHWIVECLNYASILCVLVGILLLVLFGYLNFF